MLYSSNRFLFGYSVLRWQGILSVANIFSERSKCVAEVHLEVQGHTHTSTHFAYHTVLINAINLYFEFNAIIRIVDLKLIVYRYLTVKQQLQLLFVGTEFRIRTCFPQVQVSFEGR